MKEITDFHPTIQSSQIHHARQTVTPWQNYGDLGTTAASMYILCQ